MKNLGNKNKFKIQRALGLELPGLGKSGSLDKRNYPPGQHGKDKKKKPTGYATQLQEKQKLLFHYGIREEQLRRFVRKAKKSSESDWMEQLIGLLELRLDNIVFRLGFARSIAAARQLVSHGHVLVDGRRETIGSMVLWIGARIRLTNRANAFEATKHARSTPRLDVASYLQLELTDDADAGIVVSRPRSEHVPFLFNKALVAEYYATRGL
jgi:small subunit ribosomal protein S4